MTHIEESIDVHVPIRVAYNQWTQFEVLPRFLEGVGSVHALDSMRLHWRASVGGRGVEGAAVITELIPDQRIGWRSTGGPEASGTISFQAVDVGRCRVTLTLNLPEVGSGQAPGSASAMSARVQGDLYRFKRLVETQPHETAAWRGPAPGGVAIAPQAPRSGGPAI